MERYITKNTHTYRVLEDPYPSRVTITKKYIKNILPVENHYLNPADRLAWHIKGYKGKVL